MGFNYAAVKSITNSDFWGGNRDVLEKCEKVSKCYESGDLRHFLSGSREILEVFINYLYKRLTRKKSMPRMLGEKISDVDFKVALDNADLISAAEQINQITRKYHHDPERRDSETDEEFRARIKYEDEKEVPVHTSEVLQKMSLFLSLAANVINHKIPSVRGEIRLSLDDMYNENTESTKKVLLASLEDVDSYDDYARTWEIEGQGKIPYSGRALILRRNYVEKVIVFKATNKKTGQVLVKKFGPIKEYHLLTEGKDDTTSAKPIVSHNKDDFKKPVQNKDNTKTETNRVRVNSNSTVKVKKITPPESNAPKKNPLPSVSFLEAELAKELLKTQEDYDAED